VALFIQSSAILYFLWKLRHLLDGLSITNETPPPYHLLRNEGDGFPHTYGTTNTTHQPSAPTYNSTQQLSSHAPNYNATQVTPNAFGYNTTQQPSASVPSYHTTQQSSANAPGYNPFEDDSDQQRHRNESMA
jgi:hypothetical protein